MLENIKLILVSFLFGAVVGYGSGNAKHSELKGMVEQNNSQAKEKLRQLTEERDRKQAELDRVYKDQEGEDRAAKAEIKRIVNELTDSRIRVRVEARDCGGGTASEDAASTHDNNRNEAEANGILQADNSERLRDAIEEIETLSAAYRSCRALITNLNN